MQEKEPPAETPDPVDEKPAGKKPEKPPLPACGVEAKSIDDLFATASPRPWYVGSCYGAIVSVGENPTCHRPNVSGDTHVYGGYLVGESMQRSDIDLAVFCVNAFRPLYDAVLFAIEALLSGPEIQVNEIAEVLRGSLPVAGAFSYPCEVVEKPARSLSAIGAIFEKETGAPIAKFFGPHGKANAKHAARCWNEAPQYRAALHWIADKLRLLTPYLAKAGERVHQLSQEDAREIYDFARWMLAIARKGHVMTKEESRCE